MSVSVIVCAAGKGERAGFEKNKLFENVLGTPLLSLTLQALDFEFIDEIVLAYSPCDKAEIQQICAPFQRLKLVEGGKTRFETVYNALKQTTGEIVLIHDGARPFVTEKMLRGCIASVEKYGSGICATPCTDTIAVKATNGQIIRVPDRNLLANIQTPQGFYLKDIARAYEEAKTKGKAYVVESLNGTNKQSKIVHTNRQYTDDSSVYADFIGFPTLCEGSEENIKFTHPSDFAKFAKTERTGFGVDTHAFGKAQDYIMLCGVKIPSESGLIAHSNGDVAIHALMDALLSGAGLRDIGHYFPDTDEKWKDADSMEMLKKALDIIQEQGFTPKNVSIAIQAEKPKLASYIRKMKTRLSESLKISESAIGITAGTNEKLGYVGEGKGITVYASVLLK
ncbi:MAG: 2-C-methyl-D-erythritol 2,4-cyclodiphosphate synthase [Clostridia bacterium]|nr:2-C-methyl-D-erythritol 2,4-cyclodiphosphate synthase [Clostridia bacterium]